jgi:hypothetical protein
MLDLLRIKTPRMIRLAPANHCIDTFPCEKSCVKSITK